MTADVARVDLAPGLSISRVLTGLWQIADMERDGRQLDRDRAAAAMAPYAAAGLTTFDMADHYGSAELIAGAFRAASSTDVQLLTKWVPKPGPVTMTDARAAVDRARARLGVEAIDLLQFHAWNYADPSWLETLFLLQELKNEGLIRHLGLTNVDTAHLNVAIASGIEIVSNQVSFSLIDQRAARALAPYCAAHGVGLLAYGTVAGGWLTERWLGKDEPDWERTGTWSQMKYARFIRSAGGWSALQRVLTAAATVAARHAVSIPVVASRYVLDQPGVAGVIVGARLGERSHVDDARRIFALRLTDEDRSGDCGRARDAAADSRRLRRRVPHAAVSHRIRRPQSSSQRDAAALSHGSRPGRTHALPERHAVGVDGRLRPRRAARLAHQRVGHDRDARVTRHRRPRSRGPGAFRHRQDRRRAAIARRLTRRRRPHPRVREEHR